MTTTVTAEKTAKTAVPQWQGFTGGLWQKEINVRAFIQREPVTRFLVSAVAFVGLMNVDLHAGQTSRHLRRVVMTRVVHQNDRIHDPLLDDLVVRLPQRPLRIVSRHDDDDFVAAEHWREVVRSAGILKGETL